MILTCPVCRVRGEHWEYPSVPCVVCKECEATYDLHKVKESFVVSEAPNAPGLTQAQKEVKALDVELAKLEAQERRLEALERSVAALGKLEETRWRTGYSDLVGRPPGYCPECGWTVCRCAKSATSAKD